MSLKLFKNTGAPDWIRTSDTGIRNPLLYPLLSYGGTNKLLRLQRDDSLSPGDPPFFPAPWGNGRDACAARVYYRWL